MLLLPIEDLRSRTGFDDIPDVNAAFSSALSAATSTLSQELRTAFTSGSYTDLFFVDSVFKMGATIRVPLLLKRGFVSGVTTATCASLRADLVTGADISSYLLLDSERGMVTVLDYDVSGMYVSITYNAGFAADDSNSEIYEQGSVPTWLKDAASLQALITIDTANPTLRREDKGGGDVDVMRSQLETLLTSRKRYLPQALRSL